MIEAKKTLDNCVYGHNNVIFFFINCSFICVSFCQVEKIDLPSVIFGGKFGYLLFVCRFRGPDWMEKVSSKTKTRFCFSFSRYRLDRRNTQISDFWNFLL